MFAASRHDSSDKVAIVTGGASGIGRALCEELARAGTTVIVADINIEGAEKVAAAVAAAGGRARAAKLDVSQRADVRQLVDETTRQHGRLDYMFNNAGIALAGEVRHTPPESWQRMLEVDLWGVIHGTTAAYDVMVGQGFGHIVNTASIAGLIPGPAQTPYCTAKHAVVGLSMSLRGEAAGLGVRVSVVCPGFVRTDIWDAMTVLKADGEDAGAITLEAMTKELPIRMMDPGRAARTILRGLRRNRGIIVFPFHARLLWWLYRLHPSLVKPLGRQMLKTLRP